MIILGLVLAFAAGVCVGVILSPSERDAFSRGFREGRDSAPPAAPEPTPVDWIGPWPPGDEVRRLRALVDRLAPLESEVFHLRECLHAAVARADDAEDSLAKKRGAE